MGRIVRWTSPRPNFDRVVNDVEAISRSLSDTHHQGNLTKNERTTAHGRQHRRVTERLAACADSQSIESSRIVCSITGGPKAARIFPHVARNLSAAGDLVEDLRPNGRCNRER